jgi:hypothetical protein
MRNLQPRLDVAVAVEALDELVVARSGGRGNILAVARHKLHLKQQTLKPGYRTSGSEG